MELLYNIDEDLYIRLKYCKIIIESKLMFLLIIINELMQKFD